MCAEHRSQALNCSGPLTPDWAKPLTYNENVGSGRQKGGFCTTIQRIDTIHYSYGETLQARYCGGFVREPLRISTANLVGLVPGSAGVRVWAGVTFTVAEHAIHIPAAAEGALA